jgi:hypothetical protein
MPVAPFEPSGSVKVSSPRSCTADTVVPPIVIGAVPTTFHSVVSTVSPLAHDARHALPAVVGRGTKAVPGGQE